MTMCVSDGPIAATTLMASTAAGIARNRSVIRMRPESTKPPAAPATRPTAPPMRTPMAMIRSAVNHVVCTPSNTRLSMSRPASSVPSGNAELGLAYGVPT